MGEHDALIALAERYRWTPAQVARMDPDYVEELLIRLAAEGDAERAKRGRKKGSRKSGRNSVIEEAELSEIE